MYDVAPASQYAPNTVAKNDNYTTSPMGQYAVAAVSASPPRMMSVQLPANVSPGQQLRIQSPEGILFDVRQLRLSSKSFHFFKL